MYFIGHKHRIQRDKVTVTRKEKGKKWKRRGGGEDREERKRRRGGENREQEEGKKLWDGSVDDCRNIGVVL